MQQAVRDALIAFRPRPLRRRLKRRRPNCAETSIAAPRCPSPPLLPDLPSPYPYLPKGAKRPGNDANLVSVKSPPRLHRATRLATILGTAGGQGPLEAGIGAANATS
jgi:hypothetical protein